MISLRRSSIVMEEMLEACLRFLAPKTVDSLFDVFFTAGTNEGVINKRVKKMLHTYLF